MEKRNRKIHIEAKIIKTMKICSFSEKKYTFNKNLKTCPITESLPPLTNLRQKGYKYIR